MKFFPIIQFFVMFWGLGFSIGSFLREAENFLERNIMRLGIGIAAFIPLMVMLNFFRVPVDWKIPLMLSLVVPLYSMARNRARPALGKIRLSKANISAFFVMLLFIFTLYMYGTGSFAYPYFEDSDPLSHAEVVKYLSIEKTMNDHEATRDYHFLDPYPPGYSLLMSTLYQTSKEMMWNLKFFNSLIISLGIFFFYFAMKRFTGDYRKALFSTFVLAMIPCYLSHFIWSHSLIVTLFYPLVYCLEMMEKDRRWAYPLAICYAAIILTQPSQMLKLSVLAGIYLIIKMAYERSLKVWHWVSLFSGAVFSVVFWWGGRVFSILAEIREARVSKGQVLESSGSGFFSMLRNAMPPDGGTATRVYNFNDFFYAKMQNMINNPVGVGIAVYLLFFAFMVLVWLNMAKSLLAELKTAKAGKKEARLSLYFAASLMAAAAVPLILLAARYISLVTGRGVLTSLYLDLWAMVLTFAAYFMCSLVAAGKSEAKPWIAIATLWAVFTFLGINSMSFSLPIGLVAFRFWMLFAIPVSLMAGAAAFSLFKIIEKRRLGMVFLAVLALLIIFTSGIQKYAVNTAMWGPHPTFTSLEEIATYNWLHTLPFDAPVYDISGNGHFVIARDKYMCDWCDYPKEITERVLFMEADELHGLLKARGYSYLIIGGNSLRMLSAHANESDGTDEASELVNRIGKSGLFIPVQQSNGAIIFRLA